MAMKEYSAFPKAPALLKPHHHTVLCHMQDTCCGSLTYSAEKHSGYSAAPADSAVHILGVTICVSQKANALVEE